MLRDFEFKELFDLSLSLDNVTKSLYMLEKINWKLDQTAILVYGEWMQI